MNWPYIHTLINHFPIVLSVVGTAAVLLAAITGRRGAWLFALATLTLAGLSVYPADMTGDQASHALRGVWYIVPAAVREHDQAATFGLLSLLITGVASAYAWWRLLTRDAATGLPRWLRIGVVVLALWSASVIARVGYLGGRIIHDSPKLVNSSGPPS